MNNWVSVDDKLPCFGDEVEVKFDDGKEHRGSLNNFEDETAWSVARLGGESITHWRPIAR